MVSKTEGWLVNALPSWVLKYEQFHLEHHGEESDIIRRKQGPNVVPGMLHCMCSEETEVSRDWSIQKKHLRESGMKVAHEGGRVSDEKVRTVNSMSNERLWVRQRTPGTRACPASLAPFRTLNYTFPAAFRFEGTASQGTLSSRDKKWTSGPNYTGKELSY